MRNSVGKLTPTALYVHRRAVTRMPVVLRLYEYCGSIASGRPEAWNVLKLHHDSRRVAWSSYPEFDTDPHPRLAWSLGVRLPELDTSFKDYRTSTNRPLLHRKEEFLALDDPDYAKFDRLTRAEIGAGLYADPTRIGLEEGWAEVLRVSGHELRGHRLVRRKADSNSG
jgi:DNA phosphorothioation-associated putative methyltransferase